MVKPQILRVALFLLLLPMITQAHAAIKSISQFTQNMSKYPGYFTFYYANDEGKLYLEVDKLKQPFLLQQSLPYGVGSNDIGLDRGQLGNTYLAQFERMGNKVMLRALNSYYRASSSNRAEQQSVREAFASSILYGFEIKALTDTRVVIDYTPYLLSDVHGVSRTLAARKQGHFNLDTSRSAVHMPRSKSFVNNTELEAVLTFSGTKPGEYVKQVSADPYALTVHMHHSLIALPDDNYQPREFHPQSGYWSIEHKDYSAPLGESMYVRYIPRHRLEKKHPNKALSEAVKPIVYYLDPGVPEPVRTALLDGAKWWNTAFEKAGYKNAFQVKMLPEHADPMDVRYNVIQWVHRATRGWSYGGSVIDPRTGEIIKGHVTLGSLRVRQDILIAEALAAPYKKGDEVTEKLQAMALDRIRQLSAHEIGHTLGIAHNFAASSRARASVMDYPHPLVALNQQGQLDTTKGYAKGMGLWDEQVIKYGYSDFHGLDEGEQLHAILAQNRELGLEFISDRDARAQGGAHPSGHLWDNGEDPAAELQRVMQVRKQALARFGIENVKAGTSLSQLEEVLVPLYLFHRYQVEAAVKLVGGVDYSYEVRSAQPVQGTQVVARERQQSAFQALLATLDAQQLVLPESVVALIPPKAYGEYPTRESVKGRTGITLDAMALPEVAANHTLALLFHPERLNRLAQQGARSEQAFGLDNLLEQFVARIFDNEHPSAMAAKVQHRIQWLSAQHFVNLVSSDKVAPEVQAQFKYYLRQIADDYQQDKLLGSVSSGESAFKQHLADAINQFLERGQWPQSFKPLPMPPGSPI
ncbi:zinc-dependent metalloprotease [Pseudoalteromonas ruthenica]|uniref:zinc-dependent metalloprotease n=1 Tax=Pseudoalteromonas ruthenica TaxID=151081 RepID=UPI00110A9A39|nr:zinc-dependent metalloprotease [Pseudoalteromonas ruthenica]TMO48264.1 peptidase [Pseudoalteromonas ruthenica]TMO52068.1 peptidase [Pseudoalteromonas ruthenica]